MKKTVEQIKETGMINEATEIIKFAKGKINSFDMGGMNGINGQDIRDVSLASKEMFMSIKDLVNEITVTVASSKKSTSVENVRETIRETSNLYKTSLL